MQRTLYFAANGIGGMAIVLLLIDPGRDLLPYFPPQGFFT
jgi:hypothetical protein